MNEPTMDKLVQRLDRLERENRWLKRIVALVVVGIAAVVLMGQAKPSKVAKVIEAERFLLRDQSGNIRATLSTIPAGPALVLYDKGLTPRALLGVNNGVPSLDIRDNDGNRRAVFGVGADGTPIVNLYDNSEKNVSP